MRVEVVESDLTSALWVVTDRTRFVVQDGEHVYVCVCALCVCVYIYVVCVRAIRVRMSFNGFRGRDVGCHGRERDRRG